MTLTDVAHAMQWFFIMSIELNQQIGAHILLPALLLWVPLQWPPIHRLLPN
jgi:hypothetical protein